MTTSNKPSNRKRRGRGEGSITYREDKGLWRARLSLGFGPNGKRIRKEVYGVLCTRTGGFLERKNVLRSFKARRT
jgi:hypothetical protein